MREPKRVVLALLTAIASYGLALPVKADQILHEPLQQATLDGIQLWNDQYICDLHKIVEVDENGIGKLDRSNAIDQC